MAHRPAPLRTPTPRTPPHATSPPRPAAPNDVAPHTTAPHTTAPATTPAGTAPPGTAPPDTAAPDTVPPGNAPLKDTVPLGTAPPAAPPAAPPDSARRRPSPGPGLLRRGLHLLLPDPCPGCGAALAGGEPFGLCLPCRGRLRPHRPGCGRCGAPLPGGRVLPPGIPCAPCRRRPPAFAALLSPWRYEPPLLAVVHALKFGRCGHLGDRLAEPLAEWLAQWLAQWLAERHRQHRARRFARTGADGGGDPAATLEAGPDTALDAVVPVPLHPLRRWRRGYNQAERIGRPLAHRLGLPFLPALRRRRATRTQARLPRPRRRDNVAGAFAVPLRRRRSVRGRRLLLVDDVCTTGATLEAAARTLRQAGAARVLAVTVARTPPPERAGGTAPRTGRRTPSSRWQREV